MPIDARIEAVLEQLGAPAEVDRELQAFRKAARVFSSKRERLIGRFPKQWVAVYRGKVEAQGTTFQSLMAQIDAKQLPRHRVMVRFIDKNQRTMIL